MSTTNISLSFKNLGPEIMNVVEGSLWGMEAEI